MYGLIFDHLLKKILLVEPAFQVIEMCLAHKNSQWGTFYLLIANFFAT